MDMPRQVDKKGVEQLSLWVEQLATGLCTNHMAIDLHEACMGSELILNSEIIQLLVCTYVRS